MRTAFGLSIIIALAQAGETITHQLKQQTGFDLRGFKATKNLDIATEPKSFFRPNLDAYMADSKAKTKLQKMIDSSKSQAAIKANKRNSKKSLRANPQINLTNRYENQVYTGPLYFGSKNELVNVVYDTGSDWLTVESSTCSSCFGDNFDAGASESWQPADNSKIEEVEYLSGSIEGQTGTDKVCLANEGQDCVSSFEFFLINYNELLPPDMDGVLGMCARGLVEDHENGPDYIDALVNAEILTTNTFAFALSDESEQSYVDFGEARAASMSDAIDLRYLQLEDHFFWMGQWHGVQYGEERENAFSFEEVEVVYDTGSSMSMVPESMAKGFFQKLLANHEFVQYEEVFLVNCELEGWESIYMLTGDNFWVEYLPQDYIMPVPDMPEDMADGLCMLGFMPFEHDFFLAGNNFLRGYYAIHKRDSFELGLVPLSSSEKSPLSKGVPPMQRLSAEVSYANVLHNLAITWFGMVLWWVFIEGKVPDLASSSLQSSKKVLKSKKTVKKSNQKELEETIAQLQSQLAAQSEGNSME